MSWLPGTALKDQPVAADLAQFLNALRKAPTADAPLPGAHSFHRGGDLRIYDQEVRHSLQQLGASVDSAAILKHWTRACHSSWTAPPVWLHGDVAPGNLLVQDGKLSGVIDFGGCGIGDPACDLTIAWTTFDKDQRRVFQDAINLDDDTWTRAAGWGLWKALLNACKGAANGHETITHILGDRE
jgi:aminoglycoside phosphotransferase (APT) family kinase protein